MSTLTFADTQNMVAFLENPVESDGFHEIIDFLNANHIRYALTVNLTIYTSCIQQFWATAKANTVNGERQIQALIDKKKIISMESSIRSDLHLEDAGSTDCLPTATIFEELARMGYEKPSQKLTFYKAFFSLQWKFLIHTITQSLSAKTTAWNEFSSAMASAIICLATNQKFNFSKYIFDAMDFSGRVTPLFATMMVQTNQEECVDSGIPTDSHQTPITTQPSSSRSQKKQSRRKQRKDTTVTQEEPQQDDSVPTPSNDPLLSEKAKDAQAKEIADLKKRVQKLERQKKSRPIGLKRLRKVGMSRRVESSKDKDIDDIQGRSDDGDMFDINELHGNEVVVDMPVGEKQEQSAKEREPEVPLKRKDQIAPDEQIAREIQAKLDAELIEEQKLARKQEKEANIALIESWENTQAMMEANRLLAERLQSKEREELTDEEKGKLFMELMEKRRKHFVALKAQEKRNKPPTKAQKRTQMSTYLKHMGRYTYKI
ncbi:hypothetical protein Tco_0706922 [Tanacetum coccineum]|uniref:Synaptobrevin, longin-like domain protein n=1 Tax=Tanacetum coccineum TaxID=301880 RepID=A0ABQ4Y8T7_9ASTR